MLVAKTKQNEIIPENLIGLFMGQGQLAPKQKEIIDLKKNRTIGKRVN